MCFSFLTGCSLSFTDNSYKNDDVVMTVGQSNITYEELVNQYNNFYSQYYQYFMYYDNDTMMNMFYDAVVSRAIVLEKANELLSNGTIKFYTEDYEDIWNNIYDFINGQIDTKEKALLLQSGVKEEDLPSRLADEESKETAYVYKEYVSESVVKPDYSKDADQELNFNDKYAYLKNTAIYTYNAEKDEDKDRDTQNITENERPTRTVAFNQFIESLSIAAKASSKAYDLDSVLKAEAERLYKTYYESALYTKYQEFVEGEIVDKDLLGSDAVVSKFIELTNKDTQNNANEENYIEVVTKTDNESLILYHNGGETTYFTVQHILIKYDYEILEELKQHVGYLSTVDSIYRNEYIAYRNELVEENGGVLNMETSFRDEEGYLVKHEVVENDETKKVLTMVTVQDIINEYNSEVQKVIDEKGSADNRDKAMIFNKLSWKYSDDTGSLSDKLSNKIGFTIADEVDDHGSFVVDFTNGARDLFKQYKQSNEAQVGQVLTDYGMHLMMVTGKYEAGELVEVVNSTGDGYRDFDEIADELKNAFVSNMTEQTLYEYVYDIIKGSLVGEEGKYFTNHKNALIKTYNDSNKINDDNKLSYDELSKAIGA